MPKMSSMLDKSQLQTARKEFLDAAIAFEMGPSMERKRAAYHQALAEARAEEDRRDPFAFHRNFKRREESGWERYIRRNPHLDPRNMFFTDEELAS